MHCGHHAALNCIRCGQRPRFFVCTATPGWRPPSRAYSHETHSSHGRACSRFAGLARRLDVVPQRVLVPVPRLAGLLRILWRRLAVPERRRLAQLREARPARVVPASVATSAGQRLTADGRVGMSSPRRVTGEVMSTFQALAAGPVHMKAGSGTLRWLDHSNGFRCCCASAVCARSGQLQQDMLCATGCPPDAAAASLLPRYHLCLCCVLRLGIDRTPVLPHCKSRRNCKTVVESCKHDVRQPWWRSRELQGKLLD